jgi:hypothetical protein
MWNSTLTFAARGVTFRGSSCGFTIRGCIKGTMMYLSWLSVNWTFRSSTLATRTRVLFLALCLLLMTLCASSCREPQDHEIGYNLPDPTKTGIDPLVGSYRFSNKGCFAVVRDSGGHYFVQFASDCHAYAKIPVVQGAFKYEKGRVFEPGTPYKGYDCPTDAFGISGSFASRNQATGVIKYAYDCEITGGGAFTALHVN